MLHFRYTNAHTFAVLIAPVQLGRISSTVAVIRAIAAALWQRFRQLFCPRIKLVEVVTQLGGYFRQPADRAQDCFVITPGQTRNDRLNSYVLFRKPLERYAGECRRILVDV